MGIALTRHDQKHLAVQVGTDTQALQTMMLGQGVDHMFRRWHDTITGLSHHLQ